MLNQVKLTILAENRVSDPRLLAEQGLSIFVETPNGNLLFDTGQTDAFIRNARELDIDLKSIQAIVLSHGHYDHTGGLPHFLREIKKTDIYCHPATTNKKYKVYPGGRLDIGVPWEESKLKTLGAHFITKAHPYELLNDIWISGEIPRNTKYEKIDEIYQQRVLESYIHDEMHDDMALVLNARKGLIVLLGCGHAGAVNSLKHAMRIIGRKEVYALVGGMHLQHTPEERIRQIVNNIRKINPKYLVPLHCTGFSAIRMMFHKFKNRVKLLNVGDSFETENLNSLPPGSVEANPKKKSGIVRFKTKQNF